MNSWRYLVIGLLAALLYLSNLGGPSIYILDEAKNASCAMEMMQRGDFIVPTFNNALRTDKPPLHYFFMMAGYTLLGVTPFAARIFSALAGIALVLLIVHRVRKHTDEQTAFFSALILLASLQLTIQFHMAVPDPYLILWMSLSILSLYELIHHDKQAVYTFYISLSLGFLTKGLIALVFPGLLALVYLGWTKMISLATIKRFRLVTGFLIFSLLALPWYLAVGLKTDGEWLRGFFLDHNINRYTATMEGHRGFFGSPFVFLFAALFPFSMWAFQAFRSAYRNRATDPFIFFSGLAAIIIPLFFSFSKTILPGYIGPAIPFFAIVLGRYFSTAIQLPVSSSMRWMAGIAGVLSLLFPVVTYLGLQNDEQGKQIIHYSFLLLVIPLGTWIGFYFLMQQSVNRMVVTWCVTWMVLALAFFYRIYPALDQLNPVVDSREIRAEYPEHTVMSYGIFNAAFVFDYQKPLPPIQEVDEGNRQALQTHQPVMIITRARYIQQNDMWKDFTIIYRKRDLFETSETVILVN